MTTRIKDENQRCLENNFGTGSERFKRKCCIHYLAVLKYNGSKIIENSLIGTRNGLRKRIDKTCIIQIPQSSEVKHGTGTTDNKLFVISN